jgi:hypothetical protein
MFDHEDGVGARWNHAPCVNGDTFPGLQDAREKAAPRIDLAQETEGGAGMAVCSVHGVAVQLGAIEAGCVLIEVEVVGKDGSSRGGKGDGAGLDGANFPNDNLQNLIDSEHVSP